MASNKAADLLIGALWMVAFSFAVAGVGALAKYASESANPWQVVFLQNLVAWICIVPFILRAGLSSLKTQHPYLQLTRALAGGIAYALMFIALSMIPVTETVLMCTTSPLFVPLISWVWFRKRVYTHLWWGIIIGLLGIIFILHPEWGTVNLGIFLALGTGLLVGVVMIALRLMGKDEWIARTLFYYFGVSTLLSLGPALYTWSNPSWLVWLAMIGTGFGVILSNLTLTLGLRHGAATTLAPVYYVSVLFAALFDWAFWHRIPDWMTIFGAILVVGGGIWTLLAGRNASESTL